MGGCRTMVLVAAGALLAGCVIPKDTREEAREGVVEAEGVAYQGDGDGDGLKEVRQRAKDDAYYKAATKAFGLHVQEIVETEGGILVRNTTTQEVEGTLIILDIDEGSDKNLRYYYRIKAVVGPEKIGAEAPSPKDTPPEKQEQAGETGAPSLAHPEEFITQDLESHGQDAVRKLVKQLKNNATNKERRLIYGGNYRLHVQPFEVGSETLPERLGRDIYNSWLPTFTGRREFSVEEDSFAEPPDAKLRGKISDRGRYIEVNLKIRSRMGQIVAVDNVRLDKPAPEKRERLQPEERFRDCPECPGMMVMPPGSFLMGSPESEAGRSDLEGPVHQVTIGYRFAVGVYEVTFAEWNACVSDEGCDRYRRDNEDQPVINVSWADAQAYVEWLSRKTGYEYRLLSESEWEYVARAGTKTARYWREGEARQCRHANGADEALKRQHAGWREAAASCDDGHAWQSPVGRFRANRFGLYDMLGNVWEWVEDCYHDSYEGAPSDGSAWTARNCGRRVLRGGSWNNGPRALRSAIRFGLTPGLGGSNVGFRVARTLTP